MACAVAVPSAPVARTSKGNTEGAASSAAVSVSTLLRSAVMAENVPVTPGGRLMTDRSTGDAAVIATSTESVEPGASSRADDESDSCTDDSPASDPPELLDPLVAPDDPLDDPEPLLYHDEPVWRDGALVGRITSGAYGHTLGRAVGLGFVEHPDGVTDAFVATGRWEVEIACERVPARA